MGTQNRKTKTSAVERLKNPIDRYQSLTIKECLSKPSQYFFACKELSFLLKKSYSKFPKNLQSLIFQDTLFAFTLLPEMQTQSAISAANSLLQSAEFALPKQKRALAVTEYKHAVVSSKRKSKTTNKEEGLDQLPQDVLVHVFGFLEVQSLLSASAVCRSWNAAAGDNYLWKLLYDTYFCNSDNVMKNERLPTIGATQNEIQQIYDITPFGVNYRFSFEAAYKDACYRKFGYCTGYCSSCRSIVRPNRNRCSNETGRRGKVNHQIKLISIEQVAEFILDGSVSSESSSDSDSDTEDVYTLGLWAYPRHIS